MQYTLPFGIHLIQSQDLFIALNSLLEELKLVAFGFYQLI
jgi:hypothetical protein